MGSSRKVPQRWWDTEHFQRQIPARAEDKVGYSADCDEGEYCSPGHGSTGGHRLCFIPQASRRHLSVFREQSNKIPAGLWEDYLGSCVKEGLGETQGEDQLGFTAINWVRFNKDLNKGGGNIKNE